VTFDGQTRDKPGTRHYGYGMRRAVLILLATAVLAVVAFAINDDRQEQGQREHNICLKQAERLGNTYGPEAEQRKRDECNDALATGAY
jgi:hypothetical protein